MIPLAGRPFRPLHTFDVGQFAEVRVRDRLDALRWTAEVVADKSPEVAGLAVIELHLQRFGPDLVLTGRPQQQAAITRLAVRRPAPTQTPGSRPCSPVPCTDSRGVYLSQASTPSSRSCHTSLVVDEASSWKRLPACELAVGTGPPSQIACWLPAITELSAIARIPRISVRSVRLLGARIGSRQGQPLGNRRMVVEQEHLQGMRVQIGFIQRGQLAEGGAESVM